MLFNDPSRAQAWIRCAARWFDNTDPFIQLNIQMLGHAEPPILALEKALAKPLAQPMSNAQSSVLTQCSALSIYWMFGLYEVLRTLREQAPVKFAPLAGLFQDVEIVRMPLAKHEVKGTPLYRKVRHYPTSVWEPTSGRVGWQVFDPAREVMVCVSRSDVADRFLGLLEEPQ